MNSVNTERTTLRVQAARRADEPLTPEELAEREREKAELLAHLEAQAEQHEDRVYEQRATAVIDAMLGIPTGPTDEPAEDDVAAFEAVADAQDDQDAQTVGVVTGLQARAGEARAAHEQSDADILAGARARLAPAYEAAKLAARKMRSLEHQHRHTLDTLSTLDWRYLRQHLVATVWFKRVGECEAALTAVLDGFRGFKATWDRLRDEVSGLTVIKLGDRTLVPRLEWELGFLADHPYDMEKNKLFRLRQTVTALDAAMKAHEAETPVPISADAAATASTRASSIEAERYRLDPLPQRPDDDVKPAPGRVRDKNPLDG